MDIELNEKVITEMCGPASFKSGVAFYRANKVVVDNYSSDRCEATVAGTEDFHVIVEKNTIEGFHATCTCPTLPSLKTKCQHIAAVLLEIYEHQPRRRALVGPESQALSEGLLTLFNDRPIRSSRHQLHFENRQVLDVLFTCKPVYISKGQHIIGIELKVGSAYVQNIRDFLRQVKQGNSSLLSTSLTYDPNLHCFQKETDDVMQRLIQVIHDEKVYVESESNLTISNQTLLIPPSSWKQLVPLLTKAPFVKLAYQGNIFEGLHVSNEPLSLQFNFEETENKSYQLKTKGLDRTIVLKAYQSVLIDGKLTPLQSEDCNRLSDLKQMLDASKTTEISIPNDKLNFFLEKVSPGLKRLGEVQFSKSITTKLQHTPLDAKLYLDRVKNRLLVGLEFHYENIMTNPLESRELPGGSTVIRDVEKEDTILQLMDDSGFAKTEGGYFLHNEELEYAFLYHAVPKLQKLVQIYATTAVRNRITKKSAHPRIRVKHKKERTNWLEFKFEMDIPEKQIREVLVALEEKRKYYRLRNGSLLSLETREFEEIKRFLNAAPVQEEDDPESHLNVPIVRGLRLLDATDDRNVFTFEQSFRGFLESIRNPGEFIVPESLDTVLRDYQKQGYQWMKKLASFQFGGILADDMGLGKTLQSITFILSELPDIRMRKLPTLIVCPSSVTYNWLNEIIKFAPEIQVGIVDGTTTERIKKQKDIIDKDVIITSYPLLRMDIKWYEKQSFHTVFFDEAQSFKNPVTQTARAVKKIQADYRFALTGTPVENSLEELWSIFHVVFPELFQGLKEYSNLTRKKISRRIRPFLLRRLKEDVLAELPGKIETLESSELLPDQKELYAAYLAKLRHDTLKHLDKDTIQKNRIKILAGLTRLRQICCHPALFVDGYTGSSAKFEQLMQIIEESKLSGRRVLIFSQFTKMLELIGRELSIKELPFLYLDGHTPSKERMEISNRFNAGERNLFLISLKAGGTGLNLTGADTVVLYDLWWNPAVEEQAADRAHRIGQKNTVQVIKLVARGTIEEKMNELQEKKRHLIEEVIDSEEKAASTLTEEDIREILMI